MSIRAATTGIANVISTILIFNIYLLLQPKAGLDSLDTTVMTLLALRILKTNTVDFIARIKLTKNNNLTNE